MTRVLITGATGFIGRCAVPLLLDAGYEVHGVAPEPAETCLSGTCLSQTWTRTHMHVANLLSVDEQRSLFAAVKPTHLLHFAWHVPPGQFWTAIDNVAWLQASLDLLRNFAAVGGKRFVGAGTCAEYEWSRGGRFREIDAIRPGTLYGASKSALQMMIAHAGPQLGVETAWGRIFYPYGPAEPAMRLVPSVIRALLQGRPAPCTEGNQVRDFIFVEDVARAFVLLLGSTYNGAVNIASGVDVTVRDVVTTIGRLIGRPELIQIGAIPMRGFEPPEITADIGTLKSLGFAPACSLEAGLRRSIEWWAAH